MNTVYRAGSWFALIGPRAVIALPPDADAALVARLWERVAADEASFAEVVDALTAAGGGSFAAIPPFAAVVREGEHARIAVRGRVRARVVATGDEREITGAEVTTWSERFVPGMTGIEIRVEDGAEDPALPIVAGVVRAGVIIAGTALLPEPSAEAAPEVRASSDGDSAVPAPGSSDEELAPSPGSSGEDVVLSPGSSGEASDPSPRPSGEDVVPSPASSDEDDVPAPGSSSEDAAGDRDETPSPADEPDPEPVEGTTTQDPEPEPHPAPLVPAADEDDLGDTVISAPAPVETILPPADTIAAPLGGHTLDFRPAPAAPVQAAPVQAAPTAPQTGSAPDDGDHDGATISLAQARALRGDLPVAPTVAGAVPTPTEPVPAPVSAVPGITLEPARPGAADPVPAAAVTTGPRVRLSSGQVVALDRTVVIGRRPRATRSSGATLPHLVAVDSPQQDISRSHLEIRPEADAVVVLDLHTTNGSTLLRPGAEPVRLHPGEQTIVVTGDVIDLGDGITVAFEDLP
ncbi:MULTISPECIES: FHA domain-containing protein [unclassified Microbacterium]|uniref:FHA domain-containing protein n=1 Tax=unclassified Microbacterium TaxID=2609290 RepID=UPI0030183074